MARPDLKASLPKSQVAVAGFFAVQKVPYMQQKWIADDVIAEIASEMININNKISKIDLNRAVSTFFKIKLDILLLDNTNSYGVYKVQNEKRVYGIR